MKHINKTAQHTTFPPPYWSLTLVSMRSSSARGPQHGCMQKYIVLQNNMAALRGVRFVIYAEVWTAVQKALWAMPAKELEKTIMQKWQEQMQECILNCGKY